MIVCDFHVHIYPLYDLREFLESAYRNLQALANLYRAQNPDSVVANAGGSQLVLVLAERADCNFFSSLEDKVGREIAPGFLVERYQPGEVALISKSDGMRLWIFPGRQVATAEKLEVLSLLKDERIADGMTLNETLQAVKAAQGLSVLNWAPGKWWGKRGRIVSSLLESKSSQDLVLCDTSLRPGCWPTPRLMRFAKDRKKIGVICGSDPLPITGEERLVGTYGKCFAQSFDEEGPGESFLSLVRSAQDSVVVGSRDGINRFIFRQIKLRLCSRTNPGKT